MLPVPRLIRWGRGPGSCAIESVTQDPSLPAQGYRIDVGPEGATVTHADGLARRYALQTLETIEALGRHEAVVVEDHPDHLVRGYMLDVSRDRVPTNDTLSWLVDVLAGLRYTHLELYVEHTFAHPGHDLVWRDSSPLTAEDLRWLDGLCRSAGIELVANQNTFGHMERWLRHDRYRPMAECPDGAVNPFTGRPMAPTTLAPSADNAEFALGLVREMASHLTSRRVNIGADEPFELGQGASAEEVTRRGRTAVYMDHLVRLLQPLIAEGFEPLFWGDILRRDPGGHLRLPPGATAIVWNYEGPSDGNAPMDRLPADVVAKLGLPDRHHLGFAAHTAAFVESGYPFWVAGGTSTWNTVVGRWSNARANLLDAAQVGRAAGARGFLVTDWGDNGHLQPIEMSLLPVAYAAGVAWCADTNADVNDGLLDAVDRHTGVPGLAAVMARLGDVQRHCGVTTMNGSALFAALDPNRPLPLIGHGDEESHGATLAAIDDALNDLDRLAGGRHRDAVVAAARLARLGSRRLAARDGVTVATVAEASADTAECRDLQVAAWLESSRPGGLDDSLRHLPTV